MHCISAYSCLLYTSDAADDYITVYITVVAVSLKKIFFKSKKGKKKKKKFNVGTEICKKKRG